MNYTETQIANAKRNYFNFLQYRTVASYEPQYIGYAAAEQRCEHHNNIVREILSGNKDLERQWKQFFLNQEVENDRKAAASKAKLAANKEASAEVLAMVKAAGKKLGDYYAFVKANRKYAREFYSKKFSVESATAFISL